MAIVTNKFKRETIQLIKDNFDNASNHYYIGIGRSDVWNATDTAPDAYANLNEERLFRNSLQSVKKVGDMSFVVPRHNWSSGTTYSAYSDNLLTNYPITHQYYVMNDNNQVFICVQQGKNSQGESVDSTVQPTTTSSGASTGTVFVTSDGYAWKFIYTISALDASKFMSAEFIPVKKQIGSGSQSTDSEQLAVQNAAVDGQIIGYRVASEGLGYSSAPTLTVVGDGTLAQAIATVHDGKVKKVDVVDTSGTLSLGSGYTNAIVTQTGGSPTTEAKIVPIFAPKGGLGSDPRADLRSAGIMFVIQPDGTENDDFIVDNDFRQVGLIKNPLQTVGGSAFTSNTGIALKKLTLTSGGATFTKDNVIVGLTSTARAIIDKVNLDSGVYSLSFHQNDETGYGTFNADELGETVEEVVGSGSGSVAAGSGTTVAGEIATTTGEVLYIDNRAAVTRASDQKEDIKIVIQI